jgi:plastocyanin
VCLTAACAAATIAAAPSTPTGRIEGIVRLVAPPGAPIRSGIYPTHRVTRPGAAVGEMSNVVVFVKDAPVAASLPPMRARMMQQDESFVPKVLAITRGATVEFPNGDPFFHNVFSLSRGATFDLGRFRRGDSRSRVFPKPGLVKVFCHLHSHMSATIMVFDHPYFSIPAADGAFGLPDLPPGTYQLTAWHERIGESVREIRVEPGQTLRVEFALPVDSQ